MKEAPVLNTVRESLALEGFLRDDTQAFRLLIRFFAGAPRAMGDVACPNAYLDHAKLGETRDLILHRMSIADCSVSAP